jgi:hypothetical protein
MANDGKQKQGAPGDKEEVPVYYQPESGQPGASRDPARPEQAPDSGDPWRKVLNDEKDDD